VDPKTGDRKPRWRIVLGIVVAVAFLGLMIALHLSGGLGPGLH
jgi:LPXTG-motif cell wall-anchored protein